MADTIVKVKPQVVGGHILAHNHLGPVSRAFVAADINTKAVIPTDFTLTQSAYLARVNVTYAWWAKKRLAERKAIEAGFIPLVPPRPVTPKTNGRALTVIPSAEVDDSTVINFVRRVGIQRVLDAAVAVEAAE